MLDDRNQSLSARFGHSQCLMCGEDNPWSLGLSFSLGTDGSVSAPFTSNARLQGYQGLLHGGMIAALLDAAMTHCLFHHGIAAVTADLNVRYPHAISCEASLTLRGAITSSRSPLFQMRGELIEDGRIVAWSKAKFLLRKDRCAAPQPVLADIHPVLELLRPGG